MTSDFEKKRNSAVALVDILYTALNASVRITSNGQLTIEADVRLPNDSSGRTQKKKLLIQNGAKHGKLVIVALALLLSTKTTSVNNRVIQLFPYEIDNTNPGKEVFTTTDNHLIPRIRVHATNHDTASTSSASAEVSEYEVLFPKLSSENTDLNSFEYSSLLTHFISDKLQADVPNDNAKLDNLLRRLRQLVKVDTKELKSNLNGAAASAGGVFNGVFVNPGEGRFLGGAGGRVRDISSESKTALKQRSERGKTNVRLASGAGRKKVSDAGSGGAFARFLDRWMGETVGKDDDDRRRKKKDGTKEVKRTGGNSSSDQTRRTRRTQKK